MDKKYIILFFKGMAMGAADVVPGVSGGTIAFISGIYEDLLNAIASINLTLIPVFKTQGFKGVWKTINGSFLLTLFSGILVSVLSLAKVITWLLAYKPVLVWAFFFGLIISSILLIFKQIKIISWSRFLAIFIGAVFAYYLTTVQQMQTELSSFYLFLSGAIAICAMILPGISGAFILVLMGSYAGILNAVHQFDIKSIALVGSGALVGLLTFSKFLQWTFKNYSDLTLAVLTGFLIGSLNKVWPWKQTLETVLIEHKEFVLKQKNILPTQYDGDSKMFLSVLLALAGFLLIFALEKIAVKKQ